MTSKLIFELRKLRKLSAESVENIFEFNNFKKYLHVERQVELDLRSLLERVNKIGGKRLVLLCGSAGDGKSHLLSYLKNQDSDNLLEGYRVYNDATESSEPTLTSMDTLAERLDRFNDENYNRNHEEKVIIAINLGTLNNFIESEYGKSFRLLKSYVERYGIVSGSRVADENKDNTVFHFVNFSDYQIFTLTEQGIETSYLDGLFSKVFGQDMNNPFYTAYLEDRENHALSQSPVHANYEFMLVEKHQKAMIQRIVETVIMDKAVVSTRDILNLLHDILVPADFDENAYTQDVPGIEFIERYIDATVPMLLDEYADVSGFMNTIQRHDILKERSREMDDRLMEFYSMENIQRLFEENLSSTPYGFLTKKISYTASVNSLEGFKSKIFRFMVRLQYLMNNENVSERRQRMERFVRYLYYQNSGNERELKNLYDELKVAAMTWSGDFGDEFICIDSMNPHFWILENLDIKASPNNLGKSDIERIQSFSPLLYLQYTGKVKNSNSPIGITVDFALFELIMSISNGYLPTLQDKNTYTEFVGFIKELSLYGNRSVKIVLRPKESDSKIKEIIIEDDGFDCYNFKVVR